MSRLPAPGATKAFSPRKYVSQATRDGCGVHFVFKRRSNDAGLPKHPIQLDQRYPQHRAASFPRLNEVNPKIIQHPPSFAYRLKLDENTGKLRTIEIQDANPDVGEKSHARTSVWVAHAVTQSEWTRLRTFIASFALVVGIMAMSLGCSRYDWLSMKHARVSLSFDYVGNSTAAVRAGDRSIFDCSRKFQSDDDTEGTTLSDCLWSESSGRNLLPMSLACSIVSVITLLVGLFLAAIHEAACSSMSLDDRPQEFHKRGLDGVYGHNNGAGGDPVEGANMAIIVVHMTESDEMLQVQIPRAALVCGQAGAAVSAVLRVPRGAFTLQPASSEDNDHHASGLPFQVSPDMVKKCCVGGHQWIELIMYIISFTFAAASASLFSGEITPLHWEQDESGVTQAAVVFSWTTVVVLVLHIGYVIWSYKIEKQKMLDLTIREGREATGRLEEILTASKDLSAGIHDQENNNELLREQIAKMETAIRSQEKRNDAAELRVRGGLMGKAEKFSGRVRNQLTSFLPGRLQ
jgi:hypothetical protein